MTHTASDESIEELRLIAEAEFGEPCSTKQAREIASTLFQLYELLSKSQRQA